jgi:uroporphyrinogen-III synthase
MPVKSVPETIIEWARVLCENKNMPVTNFSGAVVLALESRRSQEMARLIETYGGQPIQAPAMREVPLQASPQTVQFAGDLLAGKVDAVIFLTGVGARSLLNALQDHYSREELLEALRKIPILVRGPKPLAVLREWKIPVAVAAPEPNTWRELLQAIDEKRIDLRGKNVGVQEYGVSNSDLLEELRKRGAQITQIVVYQWELPEDQRPLRAAVESLVAGRIDAVLFTTGVQIVHLFRVAEEMGKTSDLKRALEKAFKASIGPSTSETLAGYGLKADLEASHPKMGFLVKEAAEKWGTLAERNRRTLA